MEVFGELVKLYGLPVAVLLGALATTGRVIIVLWRDLKASYEARLVDKDNEIERGRIREAYLQTKYDQVIAVLEASTATSVAVTEPRRSGHR